MLADVIVLVEVRSADPGQRPAVGDRVRVEVRDVTQADAESVTVASIDDEVRGTLGSWLTTVELAVPDDRTGDRSEDDRDLTVWAHVHPGRQSRRVQQGDWLTTQACPVAADPRTTDPRTTDPRTEGGAEHRLVVTVNAV